MRWIKASEMLPEGISNKDIYFCKFYMLGRLVRKENATGAFINNVRHFLREFSPNELAYSNFDEIEWLDESPSPVNEEGWVRVEQDFKDYILNAKNEFIEKFYDVERSVFLRVATEDLIIAYDQMKEIINRLPPPPIK